MILSCWRLDSHSCVNSRPSSAVQTACSKTWSDPPVQPADLNHPSPVPSAPKQNGTAKRRSPSTCLSSPAKSLWLASVEAIVGNDFYISQKQSTHNHDQASKWCASILKFTYPCIADWLPCIRSREWYFRGRKCWSLRGGRTVCWIRSPLVRGKDVGSRRESAWEKVYL